MGLNVEDIKVRPCTSAADVRALARAVLERKRERNRPPRRCKIPINDLTPGSLPIQVKYEIVFRSVDIQEPVRYPSITSIIDLVCRIYKVRKMDLVSHRRTADIILPRQIAQALACRLTPHSLPMIGKQFGGRDHTTVLHAKRKIERMRAADPDFDAAVSAIETRLGGYNPQIKQYGEINSWSSAMDARLSELILTPKTWRAITEVMNREFNLNLAHSSCYGRMYTLGLRRPKINRALIAEAA